MSNSSPRETTDIRDRVAEFIKKYPAFLTMALGLIAYLIHSGLSSSVNPLAWGYNVWILLLPVIGGVLYLLFVQKSVEAEIYDKKTQIFLIISTGLSCASLFWPGIPIFVQFIEICVSSDVPFWKVLTE